VVDEVRSLNRDSLYTVTSARVTEERSTYEHSGLYEERERGSITLVNLRERHGGSGGQMYMGKVR